jgi:glycosyltransferase involved in cell wall biosynthesis
MEAVVQVPVSVVMPCFQCARSLAEAVASVRAQTVCPLELIAVDDASEDDTSKVLRALQQAHGDTWFRVIRLERNRGAATARNVGWDAARGKYIAFLDADDTWHPRKIEIQYAWMAAHPAIRVTAHQSAFVPRGHEPIEVPTDPAVQFRSPLSYLFKNPFVTPAVMLRRDLPYRFLDGRRYMEDHLLWQTMSLSGERIAILQAQLVVIHKAPYGASGLSANLLAMERGELANCWVLRSKRLISLPTALMLTVFSLIKFIRRLAVVAVSRAAKET